MISIFIFINHQMIVLICDEPYFCLFFVCACACVCGDSGLKSVFEGDSVSIKSGLTEIKDDDVIMWRFGYENTLIAEINVTADRFTVYDDVLDGRFRDRLKLDNQTGSLTITNITTEHEGRYELLINSEIKRFFLTVICEFKNVYTCFFF